MPIGYIEAFLLYKLRKVFIASVGKPKVDPPSSAGTKSSPSGSLSSSDTLSSIDSSLSSETILVVSFDSSSFFSFPLLHALKPIDNVAIIINSLLMQN